MTGAHPLPPRAPGRLGGVALVLGGALSVQFGSALAALLFPRTGVAGAVTLRLAVGALLMLVFCRPRVRGYGRRDWTAVLAFGLALAGMNSVFYQAIERIPLGPAVTLEVLGPLALSVIAARRAAAWCWAALALAGVVLLGQGGFDRLDPAGAALALTAGTMWAAYIVCSARIGARFPGSDGLALALTVAALLTLPFGLADGGGRLADPVVLGLGTGLALLASVLPYSLELAALRRLPTATFAVMMSLGPAIAAVAGWLVLGQALRPVEVLAIALVVAASAGAVRAGAPSAAPLPDPHSAVPPAVPAAVSAAAAAPPARR
ncbi:DMT family transporter [Micromonospora tulbaghiae]|uniref:EamA family transporter n=1 Tax=Micromonospora tulbaghiae TaxID=479978 RepID=UPI00365E109E